MNVQKQKNFRRNHAGNNQMNIQTSVETPTTTFLGHVWRKAGELRTNAFRSFFDIAATQPQPSRDYGSGDSSRY